MKYALGLVIGYAAYAASMEQPTPRSPLALYISAQRQCALEAIRTEFKIQPHRWVPFIHIVTRLHEITQHNSKRSADHLETWKKIQLQQCDTALLHQQISSEEYGIYKTIIDAFVRRGMTPSVLKLELFNKPGRSMQTTEEVEYDTTIAERPQIDELAANLPNLNRHITIQVNKLELQRFACQFLALAAEHEIGHYYHVDCVTSSLMHNLIKEHCPDEEKISKSNSWRALEELMEKEADEFMINGNPTRMALAKKYMVTPGHWNFNLEILLFEACQEGKESLVAQLIQDGAMIDSYDPQNHDTVLHRVARTGNTRIAKQLLSAGANIDAQNGHQETPLHVACMNEQADIVTLFVETYHAHPNAPKEGGITPLMLAAHHGHIEIINTLLKAGAELNTRAANNKRAYHFALENKKHEASKRLQAEETGISGLWARLWD